MAFKIGWEKDGKWHYIKVDTKAEMMAEVADKTIISDKVSVRVVRKVDLKGEQK